MSQIILIINLCTTGIKVSIAILRSSYFYLIIGPEPQDTFVGRVYSYDYTFKLLILKTVRNPGTPEESYADSIMINTRNIKHVELLEQETKILIDEDEAKEED